MKFILSLIAVLLMQTAHAGPGAHGPNGEHLDAPAASFSSADTGPRVETFSESFELVGQLRHDELSILIDRYNTNEPVLGAQLEVALNELKAVAIFRADRGDYAVQDKAMLAALSQAGKHALIFTLTAREESDLLEGTLQVGGARVKEARAGAHAHGDEHAHDHTHAHDHNTDHKPLSLTSWLIGGTLLAVVLVAIVIVQIRRDSGARKRV